MKKIILFVLIFFQGGLVRADDYPKNLNVDIQHYSFKFALLDTTDAITGETTITVLFKKDGIDQMRLELVNKSDSLNGKGMVVESIKKGKKELEYTHGNDVLIIHFPEPSEGETRTQFTIRYQGIPADGLVIGPTKYGDRSFFSNNFPNKAKHWLPVINHPYEKATCEFEVTAPSHYQVISNGSLVEETNLDDKKKVTHWKQSVPISSWLYVLGVAEFAVRYVDKFKGKSIQSWVYPQDKDAGFSDFAEPTKHTLRFFSEYVGPFAYEKLANIQSTSVGGAMEAVSAVFYREDSITGDKLPWLNNAIIHELAHHWFGNAVTESTWDDVWLSEGFATYFTMLFREHAYGREDLVSELNNAKKRVFDFYTENSEYKIIDDRSPETDEVTSIATYQKGAWILHMLRNTVGDHDFKKGIQSYYNRYMNSTATTSDFQFEMEQASGKNLKPFFEQWLYQGGNPELSGSWRYDKKKKSVIVNLRQVQNQGYRFKVPLEIGVYKSDQVLPEVKTFRLNQIQEEFTIRVDEEPRKIVLDPNTKLLAKWEFSKQQ